MLVVVRRAALAALTATCLAAGAATPALADDGPLVNQFAQASPEPTPGGEPPLSGEPEEPLGGSDGGDDTGGTPGPAKPAEPLPNTGADAGLIGLTGFGLLAMGLGLRLRLRADDGRLA